jgi:DcaP outer membrane protein
MNKIKPLVAALVTVGAVSASNLALAGGGTAVDDRIAELERQIAELKAMVGSQQQSISSNQQSIATNEEAISTNVVDIEEARPMAKGTKFTYGGFVQLDAIHSSYSDGKPSFGPLEDLVVASTIPVEPTSGQSDDYQSTNIHAKSSRFFFTTKTNTDVGAISTRVELDFILSGSDSALDERISNSWNSRLRHAFVKWDYAENSSILAGQTWSTFFNVSALPDLLDFVGPVGTLFNRQPQVRWTMGGLQLAVENPATRLNGFDGSKPKDDAEKMPDLVARYNGKMGNLAWSAAAIGRQLAYDARDDGGATQVNDDDEFGYGLSLSGKWMLGKDDIRFMANYGSALGRYMGLMAFEDGYIDSTGSIDTIDQWGAFIAYRHFWSDRWRSTFSASAAGADNPGSSDYALSGNLSESYETYHANLNWLPAPKLSIGGELIYAKRELEDGRDGDLSRIQFAVKYVF